MDDMKVTNDSVRILKDMLQKWGEYENVIQETELLLSKQRGTNRDIDAIDKKNKANADSELKKGREAAVADIDKAISRESDKLKKIRADKDKAFAKGKAARIKDETAELRKANEGLKAELKAVMRSGKLPAICKSKLFMALFASKGIIEKLIFVVLFLIFTCALPYLVFVLVPSDKPEVLAIIYSAFWIVISFTYLFINNKVKIKNWETFTNIRNYKKKIANNKMSIRKIEMSIKNDSNDSSYNLTDFNAQIEESEKIISELTAKREAAVEQFETVTKNEIIDLVEAPNRERRAALVEEKTAAEQALLELQEKDRQYKEILAGYEALVDKQYINKDDLTALIRIIEGGHATDIPGAIVYYKETEK